MPWICLRCALAFGARETAVSHAEEKRHLVQRADRRVKPRKKVTR
jgi:hypothetical protein